MKLPIIDADGHVMGPLTLWAERLPAEYRDRAWTRTAGADGKELPRCWRRGA
jgi:hypothetical protein